MKPFRCEECHKPQNIVVMREGIKGESQDNGGALVCYSCLLATDKSLTAEQRRHYEAIVRR